MDIPNQIEWALVAGGAGFLGSHLCDRLIADGVGVICLDNLLSGRIENVAHLLERPDFRFIEHDVCEPLPETKVSEVWNLACPASPPRYQADPVHTMMTSVRGTQHCLELARRNEAPFFQASTSEVYGDPEVHPQIETYRGCVNMTGPRACYDEGKRAAETLCFDYHRTYGVKVKVVRIFNTYGPRMDPDDGRVVSNFIVRALQGQPLELYGEGMQTRSFCYVDDLIAGFIAMMRAKEDLVGPVNIGNPGEFTIRELAELVLSMTGSEVPLQIAPMPVDDPRQRRPDISLAQEHLGWTPAIPLTEGLARTIDHFRTRLSDDEQREAAE